eukprot:CAMPEP_0185845346 /NCGR_PEP_ID=MMETSP1354-20130828/1345_1 /TAXON_ID=708628 /ORGANISM="Erythrolobus madagascarensis, Strain CCMP3276" /LENGTH=251 /DNA_ID=CAMNT_0028545291 /DNA_START=100 /DNA_END=855 /DNA_ORIENTATION=-
MATENGNQGDIGAPIGRLSRARSRSIGRKDVSLEMDTADLAGYGTDSKEDAAMRPRAGTYSWTPSPAAAAGIVLLVVLALMTSVHMTTAPQEVSRGGAFTGLTQRYDALAHVEPMCDIHIEFDRQRCAYFNRYMFGEFLLPTLLLGSGMTQDRVDVFVEMMQEREQTVEEKYVCIDDHSAAVLGKLAAGLAEDSLEEDVAERKEAGILEHFDPMEAGYWRVKWFCPEVCSALAIMSANEEIMMCKCCAEFY